MLGKKQTKIYKDLLPIHGNNCSSRVTIFSFAYDDKQASALLEVTRTSSLSSKPAFIN